MAAPKKILYVITKSNFGGAQKYVFELAVAAKERGYHVAVACGGTGGKNAELGLMATKLSEAGIRVIPITHFMRDMSLGNDFVAFLNILKIFVRFQSSHTLPSSYCYNFVWGFYCFCY